MCVWLRANSNYQEPNNGKNKYINCCCFFCVCNAMFRCLAGKRENIHFKLSFWGRRVSKHFDVMVADRAIAGCLSAKCKQTCDFAFPPDVDGTFPKKNQSV